MVRTTSSDSGSSERFRRSTLLAMLLCCGLIVMEVLFLDGPGTLMVGPTISAVYVLLRFRLRFTSLLTCLAFTAATFLVVTSLLSFDEIGLGGPNMRHALEMGVVATTIAFALTLACALAVKGERQGIGIIFGIVLVTLAITSTVKPE